MADKKPEAQKEDAIGTPDAVKDAPNGQEIDERPAPHWMPPDSTAEAEDEDELFNDMPV